LDPLAGIAIFVTGLAFGSFLNVCISRIPRDLSIVTPGSHCPQCNARVGWRDNIPVIGWLLLKGKCRNCGGSISLRYLAVEVLTAVLFLACYAQFGLGWTIVKACVFCFLVVGLIFMDAETGLLPAEFTYPGILLGLMFALLAPSNASGLRFVLAAFEWPITAGGRLLSFLDAVSAAALGAAFFYIAWAVYYLIRKRHGVGFGDIAMIAMIGAFLGLRLTVLVIFLAPILGTLYALFTLVGAEHHKTAQTDVRFSSGGVLLREVPFGVFLGMSALTALFLGPSIWNWYSGFFT
jgi:leader peptidase (prepilin peptidase)/N-methyltransferase